MVTSFRARISRHSENGKDWVISRKESYINSKYITRSDYLIISGKHHTHEEIIESVYARCKERNIDIVRITNDEGDNFTRQKDVEIKHRCTECGELEIREYYPMYRNNRNTCYSCSYKKKGRKTRALTREELQEIINVDYADRNFTFTITEDFVYSNNKMKVSLKCDNCGLESESRIDVLKQGRKSCKCSRLRSVLERDTRKILEKHNIEFQPEYSFDDLVRTYKLRFDFGIWVEGELRLIECDGIQHFYPTFGQESFEHTRKSDQMKNEYVKENDIPLLRIRYDDKNIEQKIIEFIEL